MFVCHFIVLLTIECTNIVFPPQSNDHRNIPMIKLNQVPFIHLKLKHTRVFLIWTLTIGLTLVLLVDVNAFIAQCDEPYGCRLILLQGKQ